MRDDNLISVTNEENNSLNVEIFCDSNSVDVGFTGNFTAAMNVHNLDNQSHPYILQKLTEKVDLELGKSLTQNDLTDELKEIYDNYLNSIESLQTEVNNLSEDIEEINNTIPEISTEEQAVSGIDDTTVMSPLKVKNAIDSNAFSGFFNVINSGYKDSYGNLIILNMADNSTLSFNVDNGTDFEPLNVTYSGGSKRILTNIGNINVSELSDGKYKIFIKSDCSTLLSTNVVKQKNSPTTPVNNDIWVDISRYPNVINLYNGTSFEEIIAVECGSFVVSNGIITKLIQPKLCDNRFNTTINNILIVPCNEEIFVTSTAFNDIEYTLSFLPDDDGIYELFLEGTMYITGNGSSGLIQVKTSYTNQYESVVGLCLSGNWSINYGNKNIITNDKKITAKLVNPIGICTLYCIGYRRIG